MTISSIKAVFTRTLAVLQICIFRKDTAALKLLKSKPNMIRSGAGLAQTVWAWKTSNFSQKRDVLCTAWLPGTAFIQRRAGMNDQQSWLIITNTTLISIKFKVVLNKKKLKTLKICLLDTNKQSAFCRFHKGNGDLLSLEMTHRAH